MIPDTDIGPYCFAAKAEDQWQVFPRGWPPAHLAEQDLSERKPINSAGFGGLIR